MSAIALEALQWLLFSLSGGVLYRGFGHRMTLGEKVAGGSVIAFTALVFTINNAGAFDPSKKELELLRLCKEDSSEQSCKSYLKKYPDGDFKLEVEKKLYKLQQIRSTAEEYDQHNREMKNKLQQAIDNERQANEKLIQQQIVKKKIEDQLRKEEVARISEVKTRQKTEAENALKKEQIKQATEAKRIVEERLEQELEAKRIAEERLEQELKANREDEQNNHYQIEDSLVKDTTTGLIWMRCSLGQKWNGHTCKGNVKKFKQHEIEHFNNIEYAGYSDWRMPTIEELKTLVYCSSGEPKTWNDTSFACRGSFQRPTIDINTFNNAPSTWFWTSSSNSGGLAIVNFSNGNDGYDTKNYGAIRLVRKN